jgi:hypothetical protein
MGECNSGWHGRVSWDSRTTLSASQGHASCFHCFFDMMRSIMLLCQGREGRLGSLRGRLRRKSNGTQPAEEYLTQAEYDYFAGDHSEQSQALQWLTRRLSYQELTDAQLRHCLGI